MCSRRWLLILCIVSMITLAGCKVGTSSLFVHPKDNGYDYMVTYNVLGGHINQMKTRTVYYAKDSLVFMPSGNSGMLVEPRNGNKTLLGWYTVVKEVKENGKLQYRFKDEDRWDFDTMRLNEETAPAHDLVLYARWGDNPEIRFVETSGDVKPYVTWTLDIGSILKRPTSTEPVKQGSTLVDYYVDEDYATKYVFDHVVTEDLIQYDDAGKAYINIYCKFIKGDYKRIRTVSQLKEINNDLEGNYLLANDLDLGKQSWEPFNEFHGIFDGNGYCLKNMKITAKNRVSGIAAKRAKTKGFGLFGSISGAAIRNLVIQDAVILLDAESNVSISAGILAGNAGNCEISHICLVNDRITANGEMKINLTLSKLAPCDSTTQKIENELDGATIDSVKTTGIVNFDDN